jgi:hypothetical protein
MLAGTAAPEELVAHAATLDDFATDPVTLPDARVLQALFEIRVAGRQSSLPPGLHPTNPPTLVVQVWVCPDSPWGPLRLAQARVGCRSGLRPRGFVQGCICDNATAVDALRRRWGFPAQAGNVTCDERYDGVWASATLGDHPLVELAALGPEPLGPDDVSYTTAVALAHTPNGLRLVQIDTDLAVSRAERLRPRLEHFATGAWTHPSVQPTHPVSASIARGSLTIQRLRYVTKPDELAFTGTEPVGRP